MIRKKYAPILFGLILSGLMSLLVSGVTSARTTNLELAFTGIWISAWFTAWSIAFPVVLLLAPLTRRVVDRITVDD